MSTDTILMSTHNIGFYEEISKIIPKLSSNIIKYAPYLFLCLGTTFLYLPSSAHSSSSCSSSESGCRCGKFSANKLLRCGGSAGTCETGGDGCRRGGDGSLLGGDGSRRGGDGSCRGGDGSRRGGDGSLYCVGGGDPCSLGNSIGCFLMEGGSSWSTLPKLCFNFLPSIILLFTWSCVLEAIKLS